MAKRYFIETCVTLYHMDVVEADSEEEFREIREHLTKEWNEHVDKEIMKKDVRNFLWNADYVEDGEVGWDYDGPVISKEEFISKYTSLEA